MLGIGDSITDDVFKENLENTTSLLVDEARDTLDTATASQTTYGWLSDALDVVTQYLPVTLCATLSKAFPSFTTPRHDDSWLRKQAIKTIRLGNRL